MKKTKYPEIKTRLLTGLFIMILTSCIVNIIYNKETKELSKVANIIIEHPYTVGNSVRDIENYINVIHRSMMDVLSSKNETELNKSINIVNKNEQLIYDNFKIIKEKFLGNLDFVNDAYTTFVNSKPIRDEVIDLVKKGKRDDAAKIIKEKGNDHFILLFQKTRKMIDFANEKAAGLNHNSINIILKTKRNFLFLLIGSTVIEIILFLWILLSILNPINRMIDRIKKVEGGKIKGSVVIAGNHLAILDYAISEFENREKILEEKVTIRTKELREARNLLESSIEDSPIGIVKVGLDRKFISANQSFCATMGYSLEELKEISPGDITVEEDKVICIDFYAKALEGKTTSIKVEKRYIHKSGRIVYTYVSSLMVRDITGKPLYFFSQIRDISKQKESEFELIKHKEELESLIVERTKELNDKTLTLERSQQALTFLLEDVNDIKKQLEISNLKLLDSNKELESFSYSVSHDLKAPLRAVIGFSQILNEDFAPQLGSESKRYIGIIKENAENMGTLINDLLEFSRMGRAELHKTQVNLYLLGERVKSELMMGIKDRDLTINILEMPEVNADEKLIYHVIQNLLSNAVKYTGKVEKAVVEFGCISKNNENIFYVKDNGIGFDMKYSEKIFDVFQRLHSVEEFPGTGIGLSIVKRIINKHKGKIRVESEINKGTTFFFTV